MSFGSLFAGIGGFDLGLERTGMIGLWQSEIYDPALRTLTRHWPDVTQYGDIGEIDGRRLEPVDIICGGFPCQDLSVAGQRAGLDGERSGLFFEFMRIVSECAPTWVLIENVPGLLSSNGGRDMGTVVGTLAQLGYGWTYRVLDSQYFGVAQRRQRVFIVGCAGGRTASAVNVLLEPESVSGHTPPSRQARSGLAIATANSLRSSGPPGTRTDDEAGLVVIKGAAIGRKPEAGPQYGEILLDGSVYTLNTIDRHAAAYTIQTKAGMKQQGFVAWHENKQGELSVGDIASTLRSGASHSYQGIGIRRLTPTECEQLQGFDDGWTEGESDSARYRMLGNAVTVPVVEWIGRRIMATQGGLL